MVRSTRHGSLFPTIRKLHAWSGLCLSLVLAILSLSGVLLIFKDDYLAARFPEVRDVADTAPESLGSAIESFERKFSQQRLSYVLLPRPGFGLYRIVLRNGEAAYAVSSGEVVERWSGNARIEDWLFDLHHYLLMGEFGEYLAGLVALIAVVMAGTGVYLFLPFRRRFDWRLWPASMRRRDILAYHRNAGVVFALPIFVILLTGGAMVFYSQASALMSVLTVSKASPFEQPTAQPGDVDWQKALSAAKTRFPDASPRLVIWPRSDNAAAVIRLRQAGEWHQNGRSVVYLNPEDSGVLAVRDATTLSRGERASNAIYPIHSTGIGGRIYDLVAAVSGITLTALALLASWTYLSVLRSRKGRSI